MIKFFSFLSTPEEDPIFGLMQRYKQDPRPEKINLAIGAYQTEFGHPWVFPSVREAELLIEKEKKSKEYLSIDGDSEFLTSASKLCLGEKQIDRYQDHLTAVQTIGGTGALRTGAEFLWEHGVRSSVYVSDPTWPNHLGIFSKVGYQVKTYPYYDSKKRKFLFEEALSILEQAESQDIVLLHAVCHNPSGVDPNLDQWKRIFEIIKSKSLIPFFDLAYQGLGTSWSGDILPIHMSFESGLDSLIAVSFSKNFGLYNERVGMLMVLSQERGINCRIQSHLKKVIRPSYSNPPAHGSSIIKKIIMDVDIFKKWEEDLLTVRTRIQKMRLELIEKMKRARPDLIDREAFIAQKGMFSFLGLNPVQVEKLYKDWAIVMPTNGRINVAGLNSFNLDRVVEAWKAVVS